jgi:hypothetical protein
MAIFKGFNDAQKEVLARKMGYKGDMSEFPSFIQSNPKAQEKWTEYEDIAKKRIERKFASGGDVSGGDTWFEDYQNRQNPSVPDQRPPTTEDTTPPKPSTPSKPNTTPIQSGSINESTQFIAPNMNSTGSQLDQRMLNNPESFVPNVEVERMRVSQNEIINPATGDVQARNPIQASTAQTATATSSPKTDAQTVTTATSTPEVRQELDGLQAAKGTVSQQAQVEAATALPSANATVQGQLEGLMKQFEGGQTPAWAAGAMRMANTIMGDRGMGASTMAGSAITQAAMESAIQIAAQDAATFSAFEMKNLDNRQQARLINAQSFLQMDLANLENEQRTTLFKSQGMIQSILSDTAAENASKQFNASSQQQNDQFFANMKTQVSQFNAGQQNAMRQFNTDQVNSVKTFNAQMLAQRDQFNASNRLIIAQSNAQWRRSVTTANNATVNEANRIEAQAAVGMSMAAYENMQQRERDFYSFAFTAGENAQQRAANLLEAQMGDRNDRRSAMYGALGSLAGTIIQNVASKWFD